MLIDYLKVLILGVGVEFGVLWLSIRHLTLTLLLLILLPLVARLKGLPTPPTQLSLCAACPTTRLYPSILGSMRKYVVATSGEGTIILQTRKANWNWLS
jgi:hypothetical protein